MADDIDWPTPEQEAILDEIAKKLKGKKSPADKRASARFQARAERERPKRRDEPPENEA